MRIADTVAMKFYNRRVGDIARGRSTSRRLLSPKPGDGGVKMIEAVSNFSRDECVVPEGGGVEKEEDDRRYSSHHVSQPAGG